MKVTLITKNILLNLPSEDKLLDSSLTESIYAIRKLKALVTSLIQDYLLVGTPDRYGEVFSQEFKIWIHKDEYINY